MFNQTPCRMERYPAGTDGPAFRRRLEADPACTLTKEQLDTIFDPWSFLTRSKVLFERLERALIWTG